MAKKTHVKVRLVPEAKPDSPFFYYVKKPAGGEKAKVKLKAKKYNPATRKHEVFVLFEPDYSHAVQTIMAKAYNCQNRDLTDSCQLT